MGITGASNEFLVSNQPLGTALRVPVPVSPHREANSLLLRSHRSSIHPLAAKRALGSDLPQA